MTAKRPNLKPSVMLPMWKREGEKYSADRADVEEAISMSGACEEKLKLRLGEGYDHLLALLAGKKVDGWQAQFIEDAFFRPHWSEAESFPEKK